MRHPCKFQRVSRLDSVTARHSSSGRQPNFPALNRGRHLYSAGWPSRWALAHISGLVIFCVLYFSASRVWHFSDTHPKFALRPHHGASMAEILSATAEIRRGKKKKKKKIEATRWLYCVECPQHSTRRRSASNIHRSGTLRKNR